MSLRYALLGLLADAPQTGYELTKHFERVLSRYAWSASHSQVYPELRRMTEEQLVEVVGEGARGSRRYAITETGHERLREWMLTPAGDAPARNEFLLRLFMLTALEPADARALIERITEEAERESADLRAAIGRMETTEGGGQFGFARYAAEFGLRWYTVQREWVDWVVDRMDAEPAAASPESAP